MIKKWGERFTREHPQVTIIVEPFPTAGQEYHTKIKTMLATQTLGDLVWTWCTQGLLGEFSHLGVWRSLDERWTLETLADAARRLWSTDPSGKEQYSWFSVAGYHGLIVWARLWGGDLISAEGRKSELASPATKAAIQWIVDRGLEASSTLDREL